MRSEGPPTWVRHSLCPPHALGWGRKMGLTTVQHNECCRPRRNTRARAPCLGERQGGLPREVRLDLGLEQGSPAPPHPTPGGPWTRSRSEAVRNQQELHLPLSHHSYYHLILHPTPPLLQKKLSPTKPKGLETAGLQDRGNRARGKGVAMGEGRAGHSVWLGHGGGGGGACREARSGWRGRLALVMESPHPVGVWRWGVLMKGEDEEQFDQICTLQRTL